MIDRVAPAPPCTIGRAAAAWLALVAVLATGRAVLGQPDNPVYVDDSPRAWELFRQARDQAGDNAGEAVRLYQELLDDYAMKLLPRSESRPDHFVAVRARVLHELRAAPRLLDRYRMSEAAEARRLFDAGQLHRVALTRPLTEAGLEALLLLAQADLESGHFHAALDWLAQAAVHPDLDDRQAAHCWYMTGAAAVYLGREVERRRALEELTRLGDRHGPLRARLERLIAGTPAFPDGVSTFDRTGPTEVDELVAQPIWSLPLADMPLRARVGDEPEQAARRHTEQLHRSGSLLTAVPSVAGSRIFLNEGRVVHAVDRFTGQATWPSYRETAPPSSMDKGSREIGDLNVVAIRGNSLVTVTGHAYADATRSERTILCLDAESGHLRWATQIDRLTAVEELDGLFPHGSPVIGEGMVYVLARKVSRQLLTSCYLIALDLVDGRLRWARHIASSGGIRSRFARPFSTPLHHDGDLFVATSIGAVARIDATTGETRWLRRYNPPLSPYLADRRPWEIGGPVATTRGLVAVRPDHREVIVLDLLTGDELASAGATARDSWNSPRYLLAGRDLVYAVGGDVRAFRPDAVSRPVWVFPSESRDPAGDVLRGLDDVEIRGRVQLVGEGMLVPSIQGLLHVDAETGRATHRVQLDLVGNPLGAGPQMIHVAADRLQAFMPLDRAEQMLRQQIAETPEDSAPALALMRLGVRARDLAMALEAADLAMGAITDGARPTGDPRRELFEILLVLDREGVARSIEEGESLHAMIGTVAREADQRVEHLLAYGDWLETHDLARAVEAYQGVLSSPDLGRTPRSEEGLTRPAAAWAAARLEGLLAEHGARVYGPQADFAEGRLARLRRSGRDVPVDELLLLAREFPFADAGLVAARAAASALAASGAPDRASAALIDVYRLAPVESRAAALLGAAVDHGLEAGWRGHAVSILRYVVETYGSIELEAAVPRSAGAWLAGLEGVSAPNRLARVGDSTGRAERLPGVVVPAYPGVGPRRMPADRVLMYDADASQLSLLAVPELEPRWTTLMTVAGAPYVLLYDESRLLVWMETPGNDPRAIMLDPRDGSLRWMSSSARELRGDPMRFANELVHGDRKFDPAEVLPLVGGDTLILVRRTGGALALSLEDGRTIRWERLDPPPLRQVHLAVRHDLGLVLAGARATVDGRPLSPMVAVLDADTGRTLRSFEPMGGAPVRWMALDSLGAAVYGSAAGVESIDLLAGRPWWSTDLPEAIATPRGWACHGFIVVEGPAVQPGDGLNPLRAIRVTDGRMSGPFDAPRRGEWDRLDLRELLVDGNRLFARYGQRLVRYAATGKVLGADVVSDEREYKWVLPAEGRLLLVSLHGSEQVPGERRRIRQTYRVYELSENCRLLGEGVELPALEEPLQHASVVDGWMLMSSPSETIALDLPPAVE